MEKSSAAGKPMRVGVAKVASRLEGRNPRRGDER
jgi:hypothetical protein